MAVSTIGSNRNVTMLGKVVSGLVSCEGNALPNLNKPYPNVIFTVFIKKEDLPNFGDDPVAYINSRRIAISGKVSDLGGKDVVYIGNS